MTAGEGKGGLLAPIPQASKAEHAPHPSQAVRPGQVPHSPWPRSSHLQHCFLQSWPLFAIAFGNPTKSIPRAGTLLLRFFGLLRKELHFAVRALLSRHPDPSYAWRCWKQQDSSPSLPVPSLLHPLLTGGAFQVPGMRKGLQRAKL